MGKTSRRPGGRDRSSRGARPPSVDELASTVVRGGRELAGIEDPLEAELWASAMIGTFYKLPVPLGAREELEGTIWSSVIRQAEATGIPGLAVLEALVAVGEPAIAGPARAAADRLIAAGVARPTWAAALGSARFEGAWMMTDVFEDHEAYYATFRYSGRPAHLVNALYDKAMGEIIKDGFVGYAKGDIRARASREPGVRTIDVDPTHLSRRVIDAIESGDLYLDNDWTADFKRVRALLLARMRSLPIAPPLEPPEPSDDDERATIIDAFVAAADLAAEPEAETIAGLALDYTCDYLGEGPYRWSPIVVEQFMLDFLPRKVSLSFPQVRALPSVLRAWVRFALGTRGLEERWVVETVAAVDRFEAEFRSAITDQERFGPAKSIANEMLADGVDFADQAAVDRWLERHKG